MSGPYLEVRNTAIEQKQSFFIEYRVIQKDGREIVVAVNSRPEFDDAGEVVALFGTIQDITERKRAEEELAKHREHLEQLVDDRTAELRESEENYRTIFDNAEVGLARMRLSDGKLLEANDRIVEILGYDDRAELFSEFSPERFWADPSKRDEMVAMGFANGVVRDFEIEIIRKDGSHGWVRNYAKFFPEEDYLVNVVVDVTGKKRAEEELTRRTEILEAVMAHVDEGISMVDANLVSVTNNQRFYELLGFPPACFPPGTPYEDYIRYNAESGDYGPGDVEDQVQERV
ncbi:MAG TPA: PAS domain S-box protein, partial [Alphaproteobacteria bacterium]|nr:PAS domain S-box protein [Alphaproteobacteria bacterium]